MRPRRGPSGRCSCRRLARRRQSPDQPPSRAGRFGAALSGQLPQAESRSGEDLRVEPAIAPQRKGRRQNAEFQMIDLRRTGQRSFGEGVLEEEAAKLWERWMGQGDQVLEDEQLIHTVYEALLKRSPQSRTRGRRGVAAEIVLRMMLLKHIRNWSFQDLEREVRPNLLYREFTRVGSGKVPDAKTLGRQAQALGPEVVGQIQQRMVELAVENKAVEERNMGGETTDVESNIPHPATKTKQGERAR